MAGRAKDEEWLLDHSGGRAHHGRPEMTILPAYKRASEVTLWKQVDDISFIG